MQDTVAGQRLQTTRPQHLRILRIRKNARISGRGASVHSADNASPVSSITHMQITFKLYAMLNEYLPADKRRGNEMALEVPEGATIQQVLEPFQMPPKLVHLVLVNGRYIAPADRATMPLQPGDVLAIWPPVAGG